MDGRELKDLRVAKEVSREELAKLLRTSRVTVWRWENDESEISAITEIAIRAVLEKV